MEYDPDNKLIIPENQTQEFLTEFHIENGYPGRNKSVFRLRKKFDIKSLSKEVKNNINGCIACIQNKAYRVKKDAMNRYLYSESVW